MWITGRVFAILSLSCGSLTTLLSWLISTVLPPTDVNWKVTSILSAVTAVLQVPVFLLFESDPCSDYGSNHECTVSAGCYLLICSTVCWVSVTVLTQCVDPPLWAVELDAWRTNKGERGEFPTGASNDRSRSGMILVGDDDDDEEKQKRGGIEARCGGTGLEDEDANLYYLDAATRLRRQKHQNQHAPPSQRLTFAGRIRTARRWVQCKARTLPFVGTTFQSAPLVLTGTASAEHDNGDSLTASDHHLDVRAMDEFQDEEELVDAYSRTMVVARPKSVPSQVDGSYYADSNNSRLLLKVMPNGKRPGCDQKSDTTFNSLDDHVRLAEEQRLRNLEEGNGMDNSLGESSDVERQKLEGESAEETIMRWKSKNIADVGRLRSAATTTGERSVPTPVIKNTKHIGEFRDDDVEKPPPPMEEGMDLQENHPPPPSIAASSNYNSPPKDSDNTSPCDAQLLAGATRVALTADGIAAHAISDSKWQQHPEPEQHLECAESVSDTPSSSLYHPNGEQLVYSSLEDIRAAQEENAEHLHDDLLDFVAADKGLAASPGKYVGREPPLPGDPTWLAVAVDDSPADHETKQPTRAAAAAAVAVGSMSKLKRSASHSRKITSSFRALSRKVAHRKSRKTQQERVCYAPMSLDESTSTRKSLHQGRGDDGICSDDNKEQEVPPPPPSPMESESETTHERAEAGWLAGEMDVEQTTEESGLDSDMDTAEADAAARYSATLVSDWDALHAAAASGYLAAVRSNSPLPPLLATDRTRERLEEENAQEVKPETEPEPVYHSSETTSDATPSSLSVSSLDKLSHGNHSHGGSRHSETHSSCDSSLTTSNDEDESRCTSSDSECGKAMVVLGVAQRNASSRGRIVGNRKKRRRRKKSKRGGRKSLSRGSGSDSIASSLSKTSLLDCTIDEETDVDLRAMESSDSGDRANETKDTTMPTTTTTAIAVQAINDAGKKGADEDIPTAIAEPLSNNPVTPPRPSAPPPSAVEKLLTMDASTPTPSAYSASRSSLFDGTIGSDETPVPQPEEAGVGGAGYENENVDQSFSTGQEANGTFCASSPGLSSSGNSSRVSEVLRRATLANNPQERRVNTQTLEGEWGGGYTPSGDDVTEDDDERYNSAYATNLRRTRSMSVPRTNPNGWMHTGRSLVHPAPVSPETSDAEEDDLATGMCNGSSASSLVGMEGRNRGKSSSRSSWREERLFRSGLHDTDDGRGGLVSDEESSEETDDDCSGSSSDGESGRGGGRSHRRSKREVTSVASSRRARSARVRRLQREASLVSSHGGGDGSGGEDNQGKRGRVCDSPHPPSSLPSRRRRNKSKTSSRSDRQGVVITVMREGSRHRTSNSGRRVRGLDEASM